MTDGRLDIDLLDEDDPFEIDDGNRPHLFKHFPFGVEDLLDVWGDAPIFLECKPPADWLILANVPGAIVAVPIAKPRYPDPSKCRPIGVYEASIVERKIYLQG